MSDVNQFRAMRVVNNLGTGVYSAAADFPSIATNLNVNHFGVKSTLSGSTSAGVYKNLVSVTGAGILKFALAHIDTSTSQISKLRITLDDVVVLETITPSTNMTGRGIPGVGTLYFDNATTGIIFPTFEDIAFNKSLAIDVSTGSAGTNAIRLYSKYHTIP